ncbi:MAG: B12-binding domain-containing radical SAM protein [Magnetovibrio sp.]|nr:B12-binding domain-containing radical SAM protein [Magnetovibrio sp.]
MTVTVKTKTTSPARDFVDGLFQGVPVKRVLLVNPPDADSSLFQRETALRGRYTNYPPYGLLVLAQKLRDQGYEVDVVNLNHVVLQTARNVESEDDFDFDVAWKAALASKLDRFSPDVVGITCMFTMTHTSFEHVVDEVANKGIPVIAGGVHITNDVERILNEIPAINIAVLSEGELALPTLLSFINHEIGEDSLGQVVMNAPDFERLHFPQILRPESDDLDILPAYDLSDMRNLSSQGTIGAFYCFKPKDTIFATVLSNRGCRGSCTFCSVRNFNGKGVRQRSVSSVIDELEVLYNDYGVRHVMWLDDDLLKDHGRAVELFSEMTKRNMKDLTWDATNGVIASSCTEEVVAAMAESGCIAINIGMESGNPEILRSVKKPGTVDNFLKAAEILRKYETIHSSLFLMIGFPGETLSMIMDTMNVAREMDLDWCRVSQLQPLPNTPVYDAMVQQGLIQEVGSKNLRFNGGAYGKQTQIEQGKAKALTDDFAEAFSAIPMDGMPTGEQLTDIWFFMNYHLNFNRIFHEIRPIKIRQLEQHLAALADVISPENGFAIYFQGYLEHATTGSIDPSLIERLRVRLETSDYWQDRFDAFGLSLSDLETATFKNKEQLWGQVKCKA